MLISLELGRKSMKTVQVEVRKGGKVVERKSIVIAPRALTIGSRRAVETPPAFMLRPLPLPSQGSFSRRWRRAGT